MLTKNELSEFKHLGYLRIKNVLSSRSMREMFDSALLTFRTYAPKYFSSQVNYSSWSDQNFNNALLNLRREEPARFSAVYDALLSSAALQRMCFNNRLEEFSAELMEVSKDGLCYRGTMLRMDAPHDTRNVYGWHQDSSYSPFNVDGLNSIICWCPLVDVDETNGTLQVCERSQEVPTVFPTGAQLGKGHSVQHLVEQNVVDRYKQVNVNASAGDVVFSYAGLVHKSGTNSSSRFRFTAIVRYHQMLSRDFYLFPKD